jgi:hypothetical protein
MLENSSSGRMVRVDGKTLTSSKCLVDPLEYLFICAINWGRRRAL